MSDFLTNSVKETIRLEGQKAFPQEACGLVVNDALGSFIAFPTPNSSLDPTKEFLIAPAAFSEAEKQGKVVACYHTHPSGPFHPSPADYLHARSSGIPGILHVPDSDYFEIYTGRRSPNLEGRPFVLGLTDCFTLVADFYWDRFQKRIPVRGYGLVAIRQGMDLSEWISSSGLVPAPLDDLKTGDILLFQLGSARPNHCGVYLSFDRFLHQPLTGVSSVLYLSPEWRKTLCGALRLP